MRRIHDRPLRSLCLGALIRDLFSGKLSTRSTLLSIRSGSHVYKRPRASRFELCIFFRSDILRRVFAGRRKSLSLSLSVWFNGSTILQRAVIPGAPRRDDGHPGQGRWMQQLNRVMRIARVKILIGPQLDDVGCLYTVSSLTFDR